jgi:hypothetical protein
MEETPLARVRRVCLALPGATEKLAWGAPTFRAGKSGKLFAMFADDHHGDGRIALWCHAPKGKQEVLVGAEPRRFFRPPYVGPSGWIGLVLERIDDRELTEHVREAYLQVAPAKLARKLPGHVPQDRRKGSCGAGRLQRGERGGVRAGTPCRSRSPGRRSCRRR